MSDIVPWVDAGDLNCTPCDLDPEVVAKAATIIAENLSGHRYGLREFRIRPQTTTPACRCHGACGCSRSTSVRITEPVQEISEVRVDGEVLDASAWALWGDNILARTDGGTFPCCQPINRDPATDQGTMEISLTIGVAPDEIAQLSVQEIACEIVNAFDDPENCRLPNKVQSLTRQQLSVNFTDPTSALLDGFAGLPLTDLWLASLDADQRRRGGRVVDLSRQTTHRASAP